MNSHFRAKALCSLAKLSCKGQDEREKTEDRTIANQFNPSKAPYDANLTFCFLKSLNLLNDHVAVGWKNKDLTPMWNLGPILGEKNSLF